MKQTQTHAWSLAGEEAVTYSLARGKVVAVTRESGEVRSGTLSGAREKERAVSASLLSWRRSDSCIADRREENCDSKRGSGWRGLDPTALPLGAGGERTCAVTVDFVDIA